MTTDFITAEDLASLRNAGDEHLLLDVRLPHEWDLCHIDGATLIPLQVLPDQLAELEDWREKPIYCLCHLGKRSAMAQGFLRQQGFTNVVNVLGGIDAWACTVDPEMPRY